MNKPTHGERVEFRQHVNGQQNGYVNPRSEDVLDQPDTISLDELYRLERKVKGW